MVQRRALSTRDELIQLLQEHGPASVGGLAERVGVSEGAIRRHMDIMLAEGLVESRLERQGRGRPGLVYSLSVEGEERTAAAHYARLLERLYPALESLPLADVSGASGGDVVQRLFEAVAAGVANEYSAHVTASELPQRVEQVAEALSGEGILSAVVDEGDSYRLLNVGCPYRSTASENHACCEADRRTIELLLEVPVLQTARAIDGGSMCEYVVQKSPATGIVASVATSEGAPRKR